MATKVTMLLQMATSPVDPTLASVHVGGWSESHYKLGGSLSPSGSEVQALCRARAALLPNGAAIVGTRVSQYDIVGPKLIPRGVQTARLRFAGNNARDTDVPQMSLMISGGTSGGAINTTRFALKCIPDVFVVNGEYFPSSTYKTSVTNYLNLLMTSWGFLGRDLNAPGLQIVGIDNGLVKVLALGGDFPGVGGYARFNRAFTDAGNPISGSFQVQALNVGTNTYTLRNFSTTLTVTKATGTIRRDGVSIGSYANLVPVRVVIRKIGRPFENYRGRRSNRPS